MSARNLWVALLGMAAVLAALGPAPAQQTDADGFQPITTWHAYRGTGVPAQWSIHDGIIDHVPGGGDLSSDETFSSFELAFDWKIAPGGNSGVIYRTSEDYGLPYSSGLIRGDLRHDAVARTQRTVVLLRHAGSDRRLLLSGNARRCL